MKNDNEIYIEIARALEEHRIKIGMSKRKLGILSGITPPYLREVLRGDRKPSILILISMCKTMNLRVSALFLELENKEIT